jgi:hypothetical protein
MKGVRVHKKPCVKGRITTRRNEKPGLPLADRPKNVIHPTALKKEVKTWRFIQVPRAWVHQDQSALLKNMFYIYIR